MCYMVFNEDRYDNFSILLIIINIYKFILHFGGEKSGIHGMSRKCPGAPHLARKLTSALLTDIL